MPPSVEIAVVLTTYERPEHLERSLASLALQQGVDGKFEVIVTDDGSQDRTPSRRPHVCSHGEFSAQMDHAPASRLSRFAVPKRRRAGKQRTRISVHRQRLHFSARPSAKAPSGAHSRTLCGPATASASIERRPSESIRPRSHLALIAHGCRGMSGNGCSKRKSKSSTTSSSAIRRSRNSPAAILASRATIWKRSTVLTRALSAGDARTTTWRFDSAKPAGESLRRWATRTRITCGTRPSPLARRDGTTARM